MVALSSSETAMIGSMREAGPHAIETIIELVEVWPPNKPRGFGTAACAVVYGDRDQPSHSVRIFQFRED